MKNRTFIRTLAVAMIPLMMSVMITGCGDKEEEAGAEASEEELKIEVTVEEPEVRDISVSSSFAGTVKAESEVYVIPMMAGEVTEKNFEVGDHVNEGDVLFRIDDKAVQIAVEQAEAAVTTAQAGLTAQEAAANATRAQAMQTVGEIPYNEKAMNTQVDQAYAAKRSANNSLQAAGASIDQMGAQIEDLEDALSSAKKSRSGAEASNKNMQKMYAEYKAAAVDEASALAWLNDHGYYGDYETANSSFESVVKQAASSAAAVGSTISELESTIDNLETQKKAAEYNADSAEQQYFVAGESYDLAQMQRNNYNTYGKATTMYGAYAQAVGADSSVTTSKAAVKQAKAGLESAKLQLDYTTVTTPVSGTITAIGVSLHNMATQSAPAYTIQSDAPNKVVFYVAEQTVKSIFPGSEAKVTKNGKDYDARIIDVSDTIDSNTGLFKVEATVSSGAEELIAGSSVSITTVTRTSKNAVTVPVNCIYYDGEQAFLYTEEGGLAKRKDVSVGISDENSVEVTDGLDAGASIITSWSSNLQDGVEVKTAGGNK